MMAVTRASVAGRRRPCRARVAGRPARLVLPSAFAPGARSASRAVDHHTSLEVPNLAKTPRTWTGARTPSGLKRVRQAQSRHEVLQPRRTAAKTFVAKALTAAAQPADSTIDPMAALAEALSALDRAAKVGAIHPNAAARRKSRLTIKVNAALGGEHVATGGRVVKTTGKAAAAKAAKARIAAGKAGKAKGAQTAAGKARAALSKTARAEAAAAKAAAAEASVDARRGQAGRSEDDDQGQHGQDRRRPPRSPRPPRPPRRPRPRPLPRRRPQPRSRLGSLPPTPRRPGSPGAFRIQGRGLARLRGGRPRVGHRLRLRPEDAVQAGPAETAERGQHEDRAGAPELLAPVEGRERVGVGDAGRDEVRSTPCLEVALVDAVGAASGRRSVRPDPGRGSRCRRRRTAP